MAEYIERDALLADIRESYEKLEKIHNDLVDQHAIDLCRTELVTFCEVLLRIKDFPSADVAPVVHCCDCKYWKSYGGSMKYYGECEGTSKDEMWGEDDFCSHGERRENGDG